MLQLSLEESEASALWDRKALISHMEEEARLADRAHRASSIVESYIRFLFSTLVTLQGGWHSMITLQHYNSQFTIIAH